MKSLLFASLATLLAATAHAQGVPTRPPAGSGTIVPLDASPGTNGAVYDGLAQ